MSIKFEKVNFSYSPSSPLPTAALFDIDLEIADHSFLALIGHTGSGKSTLVQHLNALLLPSSGKISIASRVIDFTDPKKKRKRIKNLKDFRKYSGLVFQFPEYQLFENDVLSDVAFGPQNFGVSKEDAINQAKESLKLVGIDEKYFDKSPFELSGGEKRRVAIAGIIALNPSVLVLDEPTAGLDPQGTREMMELFKKIYERGTTIIIVSHDMDLVLKYATDCVVMAEGRIVKHDAPARIFQDVESLEGLSIEPPMVIKIAHELKRNNFSLNIDSVFDLASLAAAIAEGKK